MEQVTAGIGFGGEGEEIRNSTGPLILRAFHLHSLLGKSNKSSDVETIQKLTQSSKGSLINWPATRIEARFQDLFDGFRGVANNVDL